MKSFAGELEEIDFDNGSAGGGLLLGHKKRYTSNDVKSGQDTACLLNGTDSHNDLQETNISDEDMEGYVNEAATGPAVQSGTDDASLRTFTVEEAVESLGFGWFQIRIIIICGILTAADAMEMLLLSVLGPALRCEWFLSSTQVAFITTIVFIGMCAGAPLWGFLSDFGGRAKVFIIVMVMIAYFGLLTSFSPTYGWVLFLRCMVGFSIAGGASSFTLLSEYLPRKYRAKILIVTTVSWAVGSSFEIALTYLVLPTLGWRWLVCLSSVPLFVFLLFVKWLPESARFLIAAGEPAKAVKVLESMARLNKRSPMKGSPVVTATNESRGHIKYLLKPHYRRTFFTMMLLWFGIAFLYYGIILVSAEIFKFQHDCFGDREEVIVGHNETEVVLDKSCCTPMTNDDYKAMLISSFGEFVIIPFNMVCIDLLGRKGTMAIGYFFAGVFFGLLKLCTSKAVITAFLFAIRAFAAGIFNTVYIYTSEVFPTTVRSLGLGACSAVARLGSMTTPFIANLIMPDVSVLAGILIYVGICGACSLAAILLPIETKDMEMPQTAEEPSTEQAPSTFVYRCSDPDSLEMK